MSLRTFLAATCLPVCLGTTLLCVGLCLKGDRAQPLGAGEGAVTATARARATTTPPAAFVKNQGQWDMPSPYVARLGAMTAFVEERGWIFTLERKVLSKSKEPAGPRPVTVEPESAAREGVAVRMHFDGYDRVPELRPGQRLPGIYNYFLGKDPSRWRTDVPGYASVNYVDMYPGVNVRLRGQGGTLEYDLLLEPEADLSQVRVRVEGAERLCLDAGGSLVMHTALGPGRQKPPVVISKTKTLNGRTLYLAEG